MNSTIRLADYQDAADAKAIGHLLNCYASDPMGGGQPLPTSIMESIASQLSQRPYAFSILAFVDGKPAGLTNCFESFSTFHCRPLINIHDVVVVEAFRGHGLSQKMLAVVEDIARKKGCCKITLEVLQGNSVAKNAYQKLGFAAYELDPAMGQAEFWQKPLL